MVARECFGTNQFGKRSPICKSCSLYKECKNHIIKNKKEDKK